MLLGQREIWECSSAIRGKQILGVDGWAFSNGQQVSWHGDNIAI